MHRGFSPGYKGAMIYFDTSAESLPFRKESKAETEFSLSVSLEIGERQHNLLCS